VELVPVLLPLLMLTGAALATLAGLWSPLVERVVALTAAVAVLGLSLLGLGVALDRGELRHELGGWPPPIGVEYVLDPLAGFIAVVVAAIGLIVIAYPSNPGFGLRPGRGVPLYPLVLLLLGGLLGVLMSGDLFHVFVFLEIYAIASYALVSLGGPRATLASLRYLVFGTIGSGLYLLGVGFLYFMTGSLNMADVSERVGPLLENESVIAALVLIVVGLAIKMALFPLHVWLPEAHSYAPPGVAALLAAIQVKVAAYALIRIMFGVFGVEMVTVSVPVADLLVWFSAAGILFGSILAIAQRDFKRMLAYSTVAQLGYIGVGIGLANPIALVGALLHVVNHAVMKSCLFLVAGGVLAETGVKEIARYAGMWRRMPWTMAGFGIAALSMIGIPPTAGFFSKWNLFLGSLEADQWALAAIIAASTVLTAVYFVRLFEQIFTQEPQEEVVEQAREPGPRVVGPVAVLAASLLVIGLGNVLIVSRVLDPIAQRMLG
jgi:multicomponent Na+:H+ antiporter subunit D